MFDNYAYYPDSFIPLSRKGRKSDGAERTINSLNQVLPNPSEWQEFLSNDKNKLWICKLLAEFFVRGEVHTEKNNFVTKEKCFVKYANQVAIEKPELFSMHREADHRLAFHAKCSADSGDSVCIVADDTHVYILLLFISNQANGTIYFR